MTQNDFTTLSDEELLQKQKKQKSANVVNALLVGISIGIAIYSYLKNGLGFFTFFPLILAYIAFRNKHDSEALDEEIKARGLK